MDNNWRTQVASDIIRDGLGVELIDSDHNVLAEVFHCDADRTLTMSVFERVPLTAVERLIAVARERLGEFEDDTPHPPEPDRGGGD